MPRARKSTGKKVKRTVSKSPRKVRSSPKVRKVRSGKKAKRTGSKKKVNKWVQHVVKEAKRLGLTYPQALKSSQVRASYKA